MKLSDIEIDKTTFWLVDSTQFAIKPYIVKGITRNHSEERSAIVLKGMPIGIMMSNLRLILNPDPKSKNHRILEFGHYCHYFKFSDRKYYIFTSEKKAREFTIEYGIPRIIEHLQDYAEIIRQRYLDTIDKVGQAEERLKQEKAKLAPKVNKIVTQ